MRRLFINSLVSSAVLLPAVAVAQANDVFDLSVTILGIMGGLARLFWLLAIMLFFWGVVKFIANAEDSTEREKGKQLMIWGVVAFVVLVSLWALVGLVLTDTFGIDGGGTLNFVDKDGNTL